MTRKLLDTTALIHYWAGRSDVRTYLERHEDVAEFLTTSINIEELVVGRILQGEFDREELLSTFGWVTITPFTVDHAVVAGHLEADLRQRLDPNQDRLNALAADLLIAAVAKDLGAAVVTKNEADFELFEGVCVDTY